MPADTAHQKHDPSTFWMIVAGAGFGMVVLVGWFVSREEQLLKDIVKGTFSVVTTPFFLETTVFFVGITLVVLWNSWRLRREGDGWVYLAEDEPRARAGQTAGRHDALFAEAPDPEPPELELEIIVIEGLLDLGSWAEAGELLMQVPESSWNSGRVLRCRIRLAEGLGHHAQAEQLRAKE